MHRKIGKLEVKNVTEEIEVHWEISNFIALGNTMIASSDFKFLTVNWHLEMDTFQNNSDYIAVYLTSDDDELSCNIMCTFGIKKADGSVISIRSFTHAFCSNKKKFKADKFFNRNALQEDESQLLPSNTLTIVCKLNHLSDKSVSLKLKDLNTLSENIGSLSKKRQFCDITLQLPNKSFQAHRSILAARSPVFAAMFTHDTSEKQTGIVKIPDCDPESFQKFLDYIYSGELQNISVDSALHLYKISDKYNVQTLAVLCVEYISQNLTVNNVSDVIAFAEKNNVMVLRSAAQNYFNRNFRAIFSSGGFKTLMESNSTLTLNILQEMSKTVQSLPDTA